jgi:hypothetical protein
VRDASMIGLLLGNQLVATVVNLARSVRHHKPKPLPLQRRGDVAKIAEVHAQISDLAEKMEASKKAMKTVTKIYHAMCLQGERAAENLEGKKQQSHAEQGVEHH